MPGSSFSASVSRSRTAPKGWSGTSTSGSVSSWSRARRNVPTGWCGCGTSTARWGVSRTPTRCRHRTFQAPGPGPDHRPRTATRSTRFPVHGRAARLGRPRVRRDCRPPASPRSRSPPAPTVSSSCSSTRSPPSPTRALLAPVVTGGGLDWFHHRHADQAGEGAASFIMMTQVGRDDPGTFDVAVDWASPMTTRSHIATVWKVRNAVNDYVDKFDAGLVLYATVDSNPPDEAQPGDGPQTVTMVADDPPVGFPALPRAVDITIAQSLAEESTGPFGATFDDTERAVDHPRQRAGSDRNRNCSCRSWRPTTTSTGPTLGSDWEVDPRRLRRLRAGAGQPRRRPATPTVRPPAFGYATGAVRWATPIGPATSSSRSSIGGLEPPAGPGALAGVCLAVHPDGRRHRRPHRRLHLPVRRSIGIASMNFGMDDQQLLPRGRARPRSADTSWHEYTDEPGPTDDPTHTVRLESDADGRHASSTVTSLDSATSVPITDSGEPQRVGRTSGSKSTRSAGRRRRGSNRSRPAVDERP